MTKEIIKEILLKNKSTLSKYEILRIGIFGSYLTGLAKKNSDIDLLVEFKKDIDIFKFVHLVEDMKRLLKSKVDLVTPEALKPIIKNKIMEEVFWIEKF